MSFDAEIIRFFETRFRPCSPDRGNPSGSDSVSDNDAEALRLGQALARNMPAIRRQVQAVPQSDWSFHDYLERLYNRLRKRLHTITDLDAAIFAGIRSLVHEDARNRERRHIRFGSLDGQQSNAAVDPCGLQFVTALVSQEKLRKFIELLDPWTQTALYAVHIDGDGVPRAAIARRLGMKENTFNQRFQRGMDKAREKYIQLYGRPY